MSYHDTLEAALNRARVKKSVTHLGERRFWEGCIAAYECALADYDETHRKSLPDDPEKLREYATMVRTAMEDLMRTLRECEESLGRQRTTVALCAWDWDKDAEQREATP